MNAKKLVSTGLLLFSVFSLAACSKNKDEKTSASDATAELPEARFEADAETPSWEKDTDHDVTLKWYVNFDWYARSPWGEDVVSKKIKEDMNIDVEFVAGNDEKLNTMLAGGDLPDIITFDKGLAAANEAPKFALPLNQLAEKYDPYFLEHAAKKDALKWYTLDDGNVYGYPSFSTTKQDFEDGNVVGDQVFIVRKDIYEAIGEPDMSTPEGFLDALKKAHEQFPTADDGTPLVPFGSSALDIANGSDGALGQTLQDFLNIPVTEDGKYYDRDADEEYVNWLEVLRKAYNEGYISNDQFSDNAGNMTEKISQGRYFAVLHNNIKGLNEYMSNNNKRNADETYIAVDGPKNSKGDEPKFTGGNIGGWTQTFITKDTKEPQKAMELLTYLASEYGTMVATFGVEGETYELVDGQVQYSAETEELRNSDIAKFDKEVGIGNYWFLSNDNYAIQMGQKPATSIRQMTEWAQDKLAPRFEIESIDPTEGSERRNLTKINTDRVQAMVAFIQAKTEDEGRQIWDDYMTQRETEGWDKIVDYRNDKIAENIEKLK